MGKKNEMVYIEDKEKRSAMALKLREALFKKARKFAQDFGVEVAVVGFPEDGKPFTFASSSLDNIIDKYVQSRSTPCHSVDQPELSMKLINESQEANKLEENALALEGKGAEKKFEVDDEVCGPDPCVGAVQPQEIRQRCD